MSQDEKLGKDTNHINTEKTNRILATGAGNNKPRQTSGDCTSTSCVCVCDGYATMTNFGDSTKTTTTTDGSWLVSVQNGIAGDVRTIHEIDGQTTRLGLDRHDGKDSSMMCKGLPIERNGVCFVRPFPSFPPPRVAHTDVYSFLS